MKKIKKLMAILMILAFSMNISLIAMEAPLPKETEKAEILLKLLNESQQVGAPGGPTLESYLEKLKLVIPRIEKNLEAREVTIYDFSARARRASTWNSLSETAKQQRSLNQELIDAVEIGDMKKIDESLRKGADINGFGGAPHLGTVYVRNPLTAAILTESPSIKLSRRTKKLEDGFKVIQYLIERGAKVNPDNMPVNGPLETAIGFEVDTKIIKYLIDQGADFSVIDMNQVKQSNPTTFLFIQKASIFPLFRAVKIADLTTVERLLGQGVDVNFADIHGNTLLIYAVLKGDPVIVDLLLKYNADINKANNEGLSAYDAALERKELTAEHKSIFEKLNKVQEQRFKGRKKFELPEGKGKEREGKGKGK